MDQETYTINGKLTEVKITENNGPGKWTQRASLTVESKGNKNYIGTFDENAITKANVLNGKMVQVTYKMNGKFKNLVGDSIDQSDNTAIPEENIELNVSQPKPKPQQTLPTTSTYGQTESKRQTMIIRQNSWTQANNYMNVCLKAYEQGILAKEELNNEMFNLDKIKEIAHMIEKDIVRD